MSSDDEHKEEPHQADPGASNNTATQVDAVSSARISVKAPPFWKANPALWFCQLEAQFNLNRITSDRAKYHTVVAAIESSILHQVSDLVLNPPATGLYPALKKRLLDVFVESEQSRLKKLLGEIELGEQKPSSLLREMRSLAGNSIPADLLKTLYLQRLPPNIQAILSISSEGIDSLAVMADKIHETSAKSEDNGSWSRSSDLHNQISELSIQIAELKSNFSRHNQSHRKPFRGRSRSRSQTPNREDKKDFSDERKICWYHSKWGDKATSCVGHCNYKSKGKSGN